MHMHKDEKDSLYDHTEHDSEDPRSIPDFKHPHLTNLRCLFFLIRVRQSEYNEE